MDANKIIDDLGLPRKEQNALKKILKQKFNGDLMAMLNDVEEMAVEQEFYEGAATVRDLKNELINK
jgi:protein-arginine kinase activator protein McsA